LRSGLAVAEALGATVRGANHAERRRLRVAMSRRTAKRNRTPQRRRATLYFGEVMHARLKPKSHRSAIGDEPVDRFSTGSMWRTGNPDCSAWTGRPLQFHEADHGARDGSSLRSYAQGCAAEHGID